MTHTSWSRGVNHENLPTSTWEPTRTCKPASKMGGGFTFVELEKMFPIQNYRGDFSEYRMNVYFVYTLMSPFY